MRCPVCDAWNGKSNTYCVECGAATVADEAFQTSVEELSRAELQDMVYRLQAEVGRIQQHLSRNRGVFGSYGSDRTTGRASEPTAQEFQRPSGPLSEPASHEPTSANLTGSEPTRQTSVSRSEAVPSEAVPAEPSFSDSSDVEPRQTFNVDWEVILGGNWLARIGILAVVIGVGFFLKLAFDNNWIGDVGRVALGIVGGLALLGGAEYISKRYPVYSQTLSGGGVAILYLTIFAAFTFYGMIGVYPAIGLLLLVSLASAALALRHNAMALAVIAVLGAFSAPFVIGMNVEGGGVGDSPDVNLMIYIIVVDLGVLALSTFRNWRWLTLLALVGSLLSFAIWLESADRLPHIAVSMVILTFMFLIFAGATTLFHAIWRRAPRPFDYTLMVLNAIAYLALSYAIMWDELSEWMGAFTLGLALFYALLAYMFHTKVREQPNLARMAVGVSAVVLAIAATAQLDGLWISVSWAAQGAALVWLGFKMESWQQRLLGAGMLALSFVLMAGYGGLYILLWPIFSAVWGESRETLPIHQAPSFIMVAIAFYVAAYIDRRNMDDIDTWKVRLFPALIIGGSVMPTIMLAAHLPFTWVAVGWAVEALALVWVSFRLGIRELRLFGWGVFALMSLWLLGMGAPYGDALFINQRMLAFVSAIGALYAAILLWRRESNEDGWEFSLVPYSMVAAANALTLWILSFEALETVDRLVADSGDTAFYAKSLALSMVWALYASVGLTVGILRRWRVVRLASLCLLAVPIVKLFLFDSFALDQGYRVAAFLSMGGILLVGGLLYQRYGEAIRGFLFEERPSDDPA